MRLNHIFRDELSDVFQNTSVAGVGNFADQPPAFLSNLTASEHKAVQQLYARALRRAVRRSRSSGRRRITS